MRQRASADPPVLREAAPNITRLMAHRNAVSVLPLPVGARISVESPRAIAGQPSACGAVGAANDARNHSATAGWKSPSTSARFATSLLFPYFLSSVFRLPS